jgi:hypothetical protein
VQESACYKWPLEYIWGSAFDDWGFDEGEGTVGEEGDVEWGWGFGILGGRDNYEEGEKRRKLISMRGQYNKDNGVLLVGKGLSSSSRNVEDIILKTGAMQKHIMGSDMK